MTRKVKPITLDGAYRLARAILIDAHDTYITALRIIASLEKEMNAGLEEKVIEYLLYLSKYKKWKKIKEVRKRKNKTTKEKKYIESTKSFYESFKPLPKSKVCTVDEIKKYNTYSMAIKDKNECESFYNGRLFQRLCDGRFTGKEIIETLRKEVML